MMDSILASICSTCCEATDALVTAATLEGLREVADLVLAAAFGFVALLATSLAATLIEPLAVPFAATALARAALAGAALAGVDLGLAADVALTGTDLAGAAFFGAALDLAAGLADALPGVFTNFAAGLLLAVATPALPGTFGTGLAADFAFGATFGAVLAAGLLLEDALDFGFALDLAMSGLNPLVRCSVGPLPCSGWIPDDGA